MKYRNRIYTFFIFSPLVYLLFTGGGKSPEGDGCLSCHQGIMPFSEGRMMEEIIARGQQYGDPEGCIICHGGTPGAALKEDAHRNAPPALREAGGPQRFYPNPGNARVAEYTCGQCHQGYARRFLKSLTATKTESIHRNLCLAALEKSASAGLASKHFGQYAIADEDGPVPAEGSHSYKEFMASLVSDPELFAGKIYPLPAMGISDSMQSRKSQCGNCHAPQAKETLVDQHGSGCSACHVPYRRGGVYLGNDPTIDKSQPGKLLIHRLQGTANTLVTLPAQTGESGVENESYRGISLDNCFTCHHDLREENLNPLGTVMTHYGSRHRDQAGGALLCQDCHTTIEMHGDGNIPLASHAQMEVKCEDCHGTVEHAPWELPLGYGGKPGQNASGNPRGLASQPADVPGARYEAKNGYLLTSRGNPFGNVVKDGDRVVLHSASGQSVAVPVLKWIHQNKAWKSPLSRQAMFEVKAHQEKMECLSCHGDREQPLCFGCHVSAINEKGWNE